VFALALVIGASIGLGQPAPDTILLPDSLGPLWPGYHLAFGSSTDNIYVASESSDIIVVDWETFQRIKRINTGTPVGGALLVSQHNKLYCSYPVQGRVGVIGCATNSIVGSIQVGTRPKLLCYSSGSDKLYCGDTIDRTVSVIDCTADTVLKAIPVGRSLTALEYDPTTDKVYAATRDAVLAISCSADSVVASIPEARAARGLCVNKRRQELYAVGAVCARPPDTLFVISTRADSVTARMWPNPQRIASGGLACNEATDRLYAVGEFDNNYVLEFDCSGDTFTRSRDIGSSAYDSAALACDTVHNMLYCLQAVYGALREIDCATLYRVADFGGGGKYPVLGFDPARYRVMCAGGQISYDPYAGTLTGFDCKHDTTYIKGAVPLCGWHRVMFHNPAASKLYYGWNGGVGVIDEHTNRVVAQAFLSHIYTLGTDAAYSRTSNKFYFWTPNGLGVMDGTKDSLLKVIEIGDCYWDPFPCWCPDGNKLYCFASAGARYYIAVVDCNTDSVVREIDVYHLVRWFEYLGNARMLCNVSSSLALIDCRADSVLVDSATAGVFAVAHTGDGEKVFLVRWYGLEVRSSSSLSLLATIVWPSFNCDYGTFLAYSDTNHKLYWFAEQPDSVLAIDATSDTVVARMNVPYGYGCLDHTGRYLFCTSYPGCLRIYDTQSDSLVAVYPNLPDPSCITLSPEQHCIYVGCRDVILAFPDAPPGVCEQPATYTQPKLPTQTVVRNILFLPEAPGLKLQAASMLDISGRKVLDLKPGANDVRALAPGVYFVREAQAQLVGKVVIAR
jgi:DNA-binding beta-propeller fold protein YncE